MHGDRRPVQGVSVASLSVHPRASPPSLQPSRDESHSAARHGSRCTMNTLRTWMNMDSAGATSQPADRIGEPLQRHRQIQSKRTWTAMPAPRPAPGTGTGPRTVLPAVGARIPWICPVAHRLVSNGLRQAA